jgi:hypothetical protein
VPQNAAHVDEAVAMSAEEEVLEIIDSLEQRARAAPLRRRLSLRRDAAVPGTDAAGEVGELQERPDRDDALTISQSRYGTTTVVAVAGEVDLATCSRLHASLDAAVDEPGRGPVVVDLTAVTFIGSTGMAVLVDADT